jgi:hypothetical protein
MFRSSLYRGVSIALVVLGHAILHAQAIGISSGWSHLGHSKMDGVRFEVLFEKQIIREFKVGLRAEMSHAAGSRWFAYEDGERYTIDDPKRPETVYDPESYGRGHLDEEEFIVTFDMLPDRTTQYSYGPFFAYMQELGPGILEMSFSPALASVHRRFIIDTTKGTFTNLIDQFEDVHLVSIFTNDFLDVSLSAQFNYMLRRGSKFRPGISVQVEYLTTGYWNYGVGFKMLVGK